MGKGDHCAVWGCANDRRYPQNQIVKDHVGILRFYSPLDKTDILNWGKLIHRKDFKVTFGTKVCSNHFVSGYRCKTSCRNPTLFMKGYLEESSLAKRPPPTPRAFPVILPRKKRKLMKNDKDLHSQKCDETVKDDEKESFEDLFQDNNLELQDSDKKINFTQKHDQGSQTESNSENKTRILLFISQATDPKKCFKYTGLSREKLDLIYDTVEEKAQYLKYWKGSVNTSSHGKKHKRRIPRILTTWEEYILTLVRTRKGFDVSFLADTFGITSGHVSRIYNTLVPWPSLSEIQKCAPSRFKKYPNLRIIIDCVELYIQKP